MARIKSKNDLRTILKYFSPEVLWINYSSDSGNGRYSLIMTDESIRIFGGIDEKVHVPESCLILSDYTSCRMYSCSTGADKARSEQGRAYCKEDCQEYENHVKGKEEIEAVVDSLKTILGEDISAIFSQRSGNNTHLEHAVSIKSKRPLQDDWMRLVDYFTHDLAGTVTVKDYLLYLKR